jgi:hypothetical protein
MEEKYATKNEISIDNIPLLNKVLAKYLKIS